MYLLKLLPSWSCWSGYGVCVYIWRWLHSKSWYVTDCNSVFAWSLWNVLRGPWTNCLSGLANCSPQESHMINKDLPEGRSCVYVYEWGTDRQHWGLQNLIVIINFYFFWASYYCEYLEIILCFSFTPWLIVYLVEGGFRALAERSAQIMNACCKVLIYPVVVNSSFCSLHRDIGAENWHKIWNIFMDAESLHLLTLQCVAASRVP